MNRNTGRTLLMSFLVTAATCEVVELVHAQEGIPESATQESIPAPDPEAEAVLLGAAGPGAALKRTDHFVIAYNTDEATLKAIVSRLEATYDAAIRFCRIQKIEFRLPERPLEVVFFKSYADFCRYAEALGQGCGNLSGFYHSTQNRAVFFDVMEDPTLQGLVGQVVELKERIAQNSKDPASRTRHVDSLRRDRDELRRLERHLDTEADRLNRMTIQHEAAHQIFYNFGIHVIAARNPGWMVEGLACIFETPPSGAGAGSGIMNAARLQDLRTVLQPGGSKKKPTMANLEAAIGSRQLVPLRELVGDAQLFTRRDESNLVYYYAEAWSLVYYLQRRHRDDFARYLALLSTRQVGEETTTEKELGDFESIFGPLDERFERKWFDFVVTLFD